jgi:hypothetical protein
MVRCRHGKQSLGGLVTDGASSVERYVRGHFLDDTRQVCPSLSCRPSCVLNV